MSRLTIIVAATKSNGIGHNSRLPWRLPKEMKYFAQVTSNALEGLSNAVIMGRNTWESIPEKHRPLSHRMNLVTSRNEDYKLVPSSNPSHSSLHTSLASALARVNDSDPEQSRIYRTFIIGGASLYTESLVLPSTSSSSAFVDRVLLTRILSPDFEQCDVFMPDFFREGSGKEKWNRAAHDALEAWVGFKVPEGVQEENGVEYEFQMWTRDSKA